MTFSLDGWIPEPDSKKHWSYEDQLKPRLTTQTSGNVDLRPFSSPRHNQGGTNSCVANAVVKTLEIKRAMTGGLDNHEDLSVMAVYYLARELMWPPQTHVDKGTYVSHACDVLRRFGVCPESDWPWDPSKINESPTWSAMRGAYTRKINSFYKIYSTGMDRVDEVVRCLQSGNPVVYGTTVGPEWIAYRQGDILSTPSQVIGRHATVLVGWEEGVFIGENSWSAQWGDDGFYLMDPGVVAHPDSGDFWVIFEGWENLV